MVTLLLFTILINYEKSLWKKSLSNITHWQVEFWIMMIRAVWLGPSILTLINASTVETWAVSDMLPMPKALSSHLKTANNEGFTD